ncbi:HK97 gp10 family phage protein [Paenibacillus wulumuqiensis]|uniref:HK97 gp10 family phage protein n=1 Tax=Paenibacillus wulumuqiensis TaxID=1567107 RepID=UPI000696FB37|nr:HK97 gp10 family phage protein [Paenibacillus wulumuqiensis]
MANNSIKFDLGRGAPFFRRVVGKFLRGYGRKLEDAVEDGSKRGMEDALDEWKRRATDLAPLKTGNLRRNITAETKKQGDQVVGELSVTAVTTRGRRRFDYATYIHDVYPTRHGESFKNPTTSGTIPRFIDKSGEQVEDKFRKDIEASIKSEIKRRGL